MKKVNQLKAGAILSYINMGISFVIPLLYTPVMLRLLGQNEYGLYSLSQSVTSYLSLLTLGLASAMLRYMMKYRTSNDKEMFERVVGFFLAIYLIIGTVVIAAGVGITFFAKQVFSQGLTAQEIDKLKILVVIMAVNAAISIVTGVCSSVTLCYERYVYKRMLDMLFTVLPPIFNLIVLYLGYASVGMALVATVVQLFTFIINAYYCVVRLNVRPRFKKLPKELLSGMFSFTVIVFVGLIADLLYWATDKVLIGAMVGSAAVAIYNVGATFNGILQNLAGALNGVFAPRVNTYVFEKKPISEISELMIRVGRIQTLLVGLVLSGFIVFGQPFLKIWAGEGYEEAYPVALLTMIPLAIPLIQNIAFTAITAMKRHQFRAILYLILAVANVVSSYLLIPIMGIVGAALCTSIVFVLGHGVLMNWFYYKKIGLDIPEFWKNVFSILIIPTCMVVVFLLLNRFVISFDGIRPFLCGVVIYTLIYCGLIWCFSMNPYEKDLILDWCKKKKTNEA